MNNFLLIFIAIISNALGTVLLKKFSLGMPSFTGESFVYLAREIGGSEYWLLIIARFCFLIGLIATIFALRAVPLFIFYFASGFSYVLIMLASIWIFEETLSKINMIGACLIVAGIMMIIHR